MSTYYTDEHLLQQIMLSIVVRYALVAIAQSTVFRLRVVGPCLSAAVSLVVLALFHR